MMIRNQILLFVATFFIAGFIFLALPDRSFSQGCCQNTNSGKCIFGTNNETQCILLPQRVWFPNDPPCVGGQACQSFVPTGCCQDASATCSITIQDDCQDGWTAGGVCDSGTFCEPPQGCCSNASSPAPAPCVNLITQAVCNGVFSGNWSQGEVCNDLEPPTCGQVGCCQFVIDGCDETNFDDCVNVSGTWAPADTCTEEGICETLFVISPIPTLNQWGLIAMAALLGLFSLFIIIRRHRYNLS